MDDLYYFDLKCIFEDPESFRIFVGDIKDVVYNKETKEDYMKFLEERKKSDNLVSAQVDIKGKRVVFFSEDIDYLIAFHKGVWFSFDYLPTFIHGMQNEV